MSQEPLPLLFVKFLRWRPRITLPRARGLLNLHFSLELNLLHDSEHCNLCPGDCDTKRQAVLIGILVVLACKRLYDSLREPKVCDEEMTEICSALLLYLCELDEWQINEHSDPDTVIANVSAIASSIGRTLLEKVVGMEGF
jgi:hypothetical protein